MNHSHAVTHSERVPCRRASTGLIRDPIRSLIPIRRLSPWTTLLRAALLLAVLPPVTVRAEGGPPQDFGRWERPALQCHLQMRQGADAGLQESGCRSVRLDQQMAGLLSVRLLIDPRPGSPVGGQLLFAGVLSPDSRPLPCRGGRCELRGAILLQVSNVASTAMEGTGAALLLPRSQLAQGRCQLEARQARCEAGDGEGRQWSADVRW